MGEADASFALGAQPYAHPLTMRCPRCNSENVKEKAVMKEHRLILYECHACNAQFTIEMEPRK
jgi:transposase-like protein